jgi:hypothetical protein
MKRLLYGARQVSGISVLLLSRQCFCKKTETPPQYEQRLVVLVTGQTLITSSEFGATWIELFGRE